MPRSRLVQIQENQIILPEDYRVFTPKENLLVITKEFTTQYAVIELTELKVLQNTIQRKSIVPTIITTLSWTPEVEKELQKNGNGKVRKGKRSKKNGNKTTEQRITILNFIKPKKVIVVQQPQPQPQTQQNQQQPGLY
jgi:hypothetical protein